MKSTVISNESSPEIVTTTANVANITTPIMRVRVPEGASYTLPNTTTVQGAVISGAVIVLDLKNSAGDRIRSGRLLVGYEHSNGEFPVQLRAVPLGIWADLSTAQQKNAQYRGALAQGTDLNCGPYLTLAEKAKLVFSLESTEVVDWTKSYLEIGVEEGNQ
jgi:hypothetical protein